MLTRLGEWMDGPLRADDEISLFPAVLWREPTGWRWAIRGTVFQPAARPLLAHFLRRALGFDGLELSEAERLLFQQRSAPFLADRERGRTLHLRVGDQRFAFEPTAPNGHFHGTFAVEPAGLVQEDRWPDRRSFDLTVRVGTSRFERELPLSVYFLDGPGLDVITDVDDTIKITNVRNKPDAARNTFLRPFQPVPGIAGKLATWATVHQAQVHYVTGSPWQLFGPLSEFARVQGFPAGAWAMQVFRIKDRTALHLLRTPEIHKLAAIRALLQRAAGRRFVCVGDSGEKDPEIYGTLAREFPGRMERIFIRDVTGEPPDSPRYRAAFDGLADGVAQVFQDPAELPTLLS